MEVINKALKAYTVILIILSIIVLAYCFFFYLDYSVTYKYTIDNGFSNTDIIFPPPNYDAFVLISVGPGGSTAGVVPEPLGTEPPEYVYHILALRTFFLATRDLNDNGQLDFHFEARRKGEAALEYPITITTRDGETKTVNVTNRLPKPDEANSWGPYIFVVQ